MLHYCETSIFESDATTLVNPVNTVGVMGKGLAAEMKRRYPAMFVQYQDACRQRRFDIGDLMFWKDDGSSVICFPTKRHWRDPSRLEYIKTGLQALVAQYMSNGIESLAIPALGCGEGRLAWESVQPLIERYLNDLPIDVLVHLPGGLNTYM